MSHRNPPDPGGPLRRVTSTAVVITFALVMTACVLGVMAWKALDANAMPIGHAFADEVPVTEGATRIGPYSLGNFEDWQATFAQLERGIWHGLGLPIRKLVTFELERWLAETHPGL